MGDSAVYTVTLEKIVAAWRETGLENLLIFVLRGWKGSSNQTNNYKKRKINAQSKW